MAKETKKVAVVYFCGCCGGVDVDGIFDTVDEAREFIKNYLCEYETGSTWEVDSMRLTWKSMQDEGTKFVIMPTRMNPKVEDVYGEP